MSDEPNIVDLLRDMDEPLREHERLAAAAEIERLTALLREAVSDPRRNVLGDDWWKRAKAALEPKP